MGRKPASVAGTLGTKNMHKLLLLTPLLLGASAPPRQLASAGEGLQVAQAPVEETRNVTLDITGMT